MDDLHEFVEEVKSRKEAPVEPVPEFRQPEIHTYQSKRAKLRDPFRRRVQRTEPQQEVASNGIRPDAMRRKEELETYSLDTLRMVGTVEREDDRWGLIKNKEGVIYRVKPGNYMGRNHGRITAVKRDRIELVEIVPDRAGGYIEQPTTVALGK
jgi:type IV pilus assembly protein PilP